MANFKNQLIKIRWYPWKIPVNFSKLQISTYSKVVGFKYKRGPVHTAAARETMKNFQSVLIGWPHTVNSFFLGLDTSHSSVKSIYSMSQKVVGNEVTDNFWWLAHENPSTALFQIWCIWIAQISWSPSLQYSFSY